MPFPRQRSRSAKHRVRKTPGGKMSIRYKQGRGKKHKCAICPVLLQAVQPVSKKKKRLSKTEKRPERKFGGVLCGNCVSLLMKEKTRLEVGAISREEVPLNHLKYIDKLSSH